MSYPTHFFKTPGPHRRQGHTFAYIHVPDAGAAKERLAEGWFRTFNEAAGIGTEGAAAAADATKPPTRAEIEAKARELGIRFFPGWKDETILKKIAEKL